jgi:hypothetical protein
MAKKISFLILALGLLSVYIGSVYPATMAQEAVVQQEVPFVEEVIKSEEYILENIPEEIVLEIAEELANSGTSIDDLFTLVDDIENGIEVEDEDIPDFSKKEKSLIWLLQRLQHIKEHKGTYIGGGIGVAILVVIGVLLKRNN